MLSATRPNPDAPRSSALLTDHLCAAAQNPGALAVVDGDIRLTWGQLAARAEGFAAGLVERGVRPGDCVLLQLPNRWETVVATWAAWLARAIVVPVVSIYRAHELRHIVEATSPRLAVTMDEYRGFRHADALGALGCSVIAVGAAPTGAVPVSTSAGATISFDDLLHCRPDTGDTAAHLATVPAPTAEAIALVLFTSGTTAAPKGAMHTHVSLLAEAESIRSHCALGTDDTVFMPSPLSHITGLSYGIILPAVLRRAVVLQDRWDPSVAVELVERERCTFTVSSTPFLRGLTDAYLAGGARSSALRTFVCGGADIPAALVRTARAELDIAVLRTYGSTEAPTVTMVPLDAADDEAADNEGLPLPGDRIKLADPDADAVTELLVRGGELFSGYLDAQHNAAAFTDDGWFRTGDTATIDAAGRLRISGRIKDIINRGGEKYSATEVEWLLLEHPEVGEVAIVAVPDERLGERACAFVVPAAGATPTLPSLSTFLTGRGLAVQKVPEHLRLVDELPRTQSGKVQKFLLQAQYGTAVDEGQSMRSLGVRVREARLAQNMPARELARRLGVSASFLSQFERGRSQAAVSTLFAIASELGLSLDDLLGNDLRKSQRTASNGDDPLGQHLSFQTGVRWKRVAGTEPDHSVQFLYTEYDPGADSAPSGSPQTHPGDDYGYIIDGILTVETNDGRRTLGAGEAIHITGATPHRLRNESSGVVRAIWIVVGC